MTKAELIEKLIQERCDRLRIRRPWLKHAAAHRVAREQILFEIQVDAKPTKREISARKRKRHV